VPRPTRTTTVRIPEDLAAQVELVARVDGQTQTTLIVEAVRRYIEERAATSEFRAAAAAMIARDHSLAEALSSPIAQAAEVPHGPPS
jgi:predicted DNA-binding protein